MLHDYRGQPKIYQCIFGFFSDFAVSAGYQLGNHAANHTGGHKRQLISLPLLL
jgi:hypothetical protein